MAILPVNLYSDWLCTQAGKAIVPGVASAIGDGLNNPNNWTSLTWNNQAYNKGLILALAGSQVDSLGSFVLSGGYALFDCSVPQTIPYQDLVDTDFQSQNSSTEIYNPFFISHDAENNVSYALSIYASSSEETTYKYFTMRLYPYTQEPEDATGNDRTSWLYSMYSLQNESWMSEMLYLFQNWDANMRQIKVYKLNMGENSYFLFAFGVSADGQYSTGPTFSRSTRFIAIDVNYFKDKDARPWSGDESEDDAENSYFPTTPYTDSVSSRDLTGKRNPYGFNTGNGLKLAVIGYNKYAKILQGIYCGTAEGLLNKIAQAFYELSGGNDHRQADEIQSIVSAVLCCHLIPKITGIISGQMRMRTIAGYHIFGQNLDGGQFITVDKSDDTIFGYSTNPELIEPRLNSFLDFEPYTSITLHLPFMASVNLQPSALYGNYLYVHYEIDVFTGILSADIIIHESGGREYIISTQQANVRTEIPIMGNGANGAPLAQIASSVLGVARSGSPELAAAAGIVSGVDELSKASTGVSVGRNTVEGIGTYLSSRSAYLIITRPEPANPSNFLEMEGSTANLPGVVGDFTGYSVFDDVKLEGFSATDDEKKAIEALLKGGVYV